MSQTRSAAAAPLSVAEVSVAEVRAWTLLIAGLAYWCNVVRTARESAPLGLDRVVESVIQNGAFCAAAWLLIAAWVVEVGAAGTGITERASGRQIATALAACLPAVVPSRQTTILLLLILGAQLAWPAGTRAGRKIATLLFALAFDIAWTSPYALPLHAAVANLDAHAVRALLHVVGITVTEHGTLLDNPGNGFGIEILARCASSYPFSGVCLAFVICLLYLGRFPRWRDVPWLAGSLAVSVVLSEIRLSWMAVREVDYLWLHEGDGVTLYTLIAVGFAMLFPLLAVRVGAGGARRAP